MHGGRGDRDAQRGQFRQRHGRFPKRTQPKGGPQRSDLVVVVARFDRDLCERGELANGEQVSIIGPPATGGSTVAVAG